MRRLWTELHIYVRPLLTVMFFRCRQFFKSILYICIVFYILFFCFPWLYCIHIVGTVSPAYSANLTQLWFFFSSYFPVHVYLGVTFLSNQRGAVYVGQKKRGTGPNILSSCQSNHIYSIFNFRNKISTSNNWNFVPLHCYIFCHKVRYSALLYNKSENKYSVKSEIRRVHCKKSLGTFPSPAGMSLTKLSLGGKN